MSDPPAPESLPSFFTRAPAEVGEEPGSVRGVMDIGVDEGRRRQWHGGGQFSGASSEKMR